MSQTPENAEKPEPKPALIDDPGVRESFADDFVELYGVGANFHLTFATRRPVRTAAGVARVVSSRVVLSLEAAIELYGALQNAIERLESRGVIKRRPPAAQAEKSQ